MLYLTDRTAESWQKLMRFISQREAVDLVLCLYPESELRDLPPSFSMEGVPEELERVTTYGDGEMPPCSVRFRVDEPLLRRFVEEIGALEESCDNFALYRPGEAVWVACTIPHEGVSIVRDGALFQELERLGLTPSEEPPSWW